MLVVATMVKLLFVMILGIIAKHTHILSEQGTKNLSSLVVNITSPALVLASVASLDGSDKTMAVYALIIGFGVFFAIILLSRVVVKVFRVSPDDSGIYQCSWIFPNSAFMGFPVVQSLMGDGSVFFLSIMGMPYNLLFFSYGVSLLAKGKSKSGVLKSIISTPFICSVLALILFLAGIQLPDIMTDALSFIGDTTTSLSMIVLGSTIADFGISSVFKDKAAYLVSAVKLLAIPMLCWLILPRIIEDTYLVNIAIIMCAMPAGVVMAMVAMEYEGLAEKAARIVTLTTLLSVFTIPFISIITGIT